MRIVVGKAVLACPILLLAIAGCWGRRDERAGSLNLPEVRNQLREILPQATSMIPSEFEMMAEGAEIEEERIRNQSFTFALLKVRISDPQTDFHFQWDTMHPDRMKAHIVRNGLATVVHAETIRKIHLHVLEGTSAFGSVEFDVPHMVGGDFLFMAVQGTGKRWRYEEMVLLGPRQRLTAGPDGRWSIARLTEEEAGRWSRIKERPPLTETPVRGQLR